MYIEPASQNTVIHFACLDKVFVMIYSRGYLMCYFCIVKQKKASWFLLFYDTNQFSGRQNVITLKRQAKEVPSKIKALFTFIIMVFMECLSTRDRHCVGRLYMLSALVFLTNKHVCHR